MIRCTSCDYEMPAQLARCPRCGLEVAPIQPPNPFASGEAQGASDDPSPATQPPAVERTVNRATLRAQLAAQGVDAPAPSPQVPASPGSPSPAPWASSAAPPLPPAAPAAAWTPHPNASPHEHGPLPGQAPAQAPTTAPWAASPQPAPQPWASQPAASEWGSPAPSSARSGVPQAGMPAAGVPHTAYPQSSAPPAWSSHPVSPPFSQQAGAPAAPSAPTYTAPNIDPAVVGIGLAAVAIPFVLGLLLVVVAGSRSTIGSIGNSLQAALATVGMTFGAPLEADSGFAGLSVNVPVPIALALSLGLVFWWSRRLERAKSSASVGSVFAGALVPAAIAGVLTMALTFFGRISEGSGTSRVTTGANPLLGFLGALFWVSIAALLGRWLVQGSPKPFADKMSPFARARARGAMRSALTYAGLSAAAGSLVIFVASFFTDIANGLTAFVWLLPFGGMLVTEFVGGVPLSGGGSLVGSSRASRSELITVVTPGIPPWVLLLSLIPLAILVSVGLRHGAMRQSPGRVDWLDSALTGTFLTAIYLPINLYTKLDLSGGGGLFGGNIGGGIQAGLGFLMMFIAGALIPVIGAYVAPMVGGFATAVAGIKPDPVLPTGLPPQAQAPTASWGGQPQPYAAQQQFPGQAPMPPQAPPAWAPAEPAPPQFPAQPQASPFGSQPQPQAPWAPQTAPWVQGQADPLQQHGSASPPEPQSPQA